MTSGIRHILATRGEREVIQVSFYVPSHGGCKSFFEQLVQVRGQQFMGASGVEGYLEEDGVVDLEAMHLGALDGPSL